VRRPSWFGMESQVDAAKIAVDFAKENAKLQIKGGFVDGKFIAPDQRGGPVEGAEPANSCWLP